MDNPLSQISSLIPLIEKIASDKATQIVQAALNKDQYSIPTTPDHHHNGTDSTQLGPESLTNFEILSAITGGVISSGLLNGRQTVNQATIAGLTNIFPISEAPLPVIYGVGTTTALTMTGTPGVSAVSATLTAPWGGTTANYSSYFSSGIVRNINYTNGSAAITWSTPLQISAGSTALLVTAGSRFNGGEAPDGTVVIFRNDTDNIYQIWFRTQPGTTDAAWWGIDAGAGQFVYR